MIPTIIISSITCLGITASILFFPHLKIGKFRLDTYWLIAFVGALILVIFSFAPIKEVLKQLTTDDEINPLKILILFFSMTFLSIFLDETGLFKYLAIKATEKAHSSQILLFFIFYLLTSVLTIFTSNDIVILTLTPFIVFFCKSTKINPLPYLIGEFAAANTWSMMFIIGNPTNIYLATSAGIDFIPYFKVMALPTLAAGVVEIGIIFLLFYKQLKTPIVIVEEEYEIESKTDLVLGIIHLAICLIFLIISSYLNIQMWIVSLSCAASLFICIVLLRLITKKRWYYISESLRRLPYQLIPFFLSMFVIVVAINYQGISLEISKLLRTGPTTLMYGILSFFSANIINNIPMSILFATLSANLTGDMYIKAIYASIVGSNIGAFLTPIGALAGIMFSSLLMKYEVKFTFLDFIKYGAIISIPTLLSALAVLVLIL